jgi:PAS domain S-box-containing protein
MSERYQRVVTKLMARAHGDRYFPARDSTGARSFHLLLVVVFVVIAATSAVTIPIFDARKLAALAVVAAQLVSLIVCLRLLRRGRPGTAAWVSLSTFWASTELISAFSGGLHSPVQGVVFLIVIHAGWLLGRKGALVFGGITALASTAAAVVEQLGHSFPKYLPLPAIVVLNWQMVTLILTLVLSTILVTTNQELLDRARRSEAKLAALFRFSSVRNIRSNFRTLTEDAPIAISIAREGRIVYANPTYLRIFGFDRADSLYGSPVMDRFAPQCRQGELDRTTRRDRGLPVLKDYEAIGRRADGSEFPLLIASAKMHFAEGPSLVSFISDLTGPKQVEQERRQTERQLRQAQKMESIGRLAGGVAHNFNNLLTVINGYSKMILGDLQLGDPLHNQLEEIYNAGERAAELTHQLLAFGRKQVLQPRLLNLNTLVAELKPMILELVGEDIDVQTMLCAEPPTICADPHQLEQAIMNLAANARDAMPRGGRLSIGTSVAERDRGYTDLHPDVSPARYAGLEVSDTGMGMDEATRQRIFEPFFTTKGVGQGTGLGLSMVEGFVKQSGGHIEVSSDLGRGTSFRIYLPIKAEAPDSGERATLPAPPRRKTILVVDDQMEVREYVVAVLEAHGYHVIQAQSAAEAILICEERHDHIDVLLTEVVMPETSGRQLADTLAKRLAGIHALFMFGYGDDAIVRDGMLEEGAHFIQKPFSPAELAGKVREVLASSDRQS